MTLSPSARIQTWLERWRPILPLLAAEFIVWVGFGALLPVLPIFFREHGVDLAMMGLVVAAWPAARLLAEPAFGWLADRTRRVPLMLAGLVGTGLFVLLPLWFATPAAFLVLRALTGLASAIYDPAARGYVVDATPADRRGEAFGLYGAAQMGGLLLGPAIGGLGAAVVGDISFVFAFCAIATWVAALGVGLFVHEAASPRTRTATPVAGRVGLPVDETVVAGEPIAVAVRDDAPGAVSAADEPARPRSLWNRLLLAAVIIEVGSYYASGTYEVIWSLYLDAKGAGLDLIGLTFAMFGLPILLLSPYAGRLVDRRGVLAFIIGGSIAAATCGVLYTVAPDPVWFVPIVLVEATGFAFLGPALFTVVAAGSPLGRSSTAQGIFGSAGTVGTIDRRGHGRVSRGDRPAAAVLGLLGGHARLTRDRARCRRACPGGSEADARRASIVR